MRKYIVAGIAFCAAVYTVALAQIMFKPAENSSAFETTTLYEALAFMP